MSTSTLIAGPLSKMGRTELAQIPVPQATRTHRPVPHHEIVAALVETLSFRHIGVDSLFDLLTHWIGISTRDCVNL